MGGVNKKASIKQVKDELKVRGLSQHEVSVRHLGQSFYGQSFVATVPERKQNVVLGGHPWAEGITVREFLPNIRRRQLEAAKPKTPSWGSMGDPPRDIQPFRTWRRWNTPWRRNTRSLYHDRPQRSSQQYWSHSQFPWPMTNGLRSYEGYSNPQWGGRSDGGYNYEFPPLYPRSNSWNYRYW